MTELLSVRKVREQHLVTVDLGDGTHVQARREDMTILVFEGRVPMPLLTAVQRMIEMPDASPIERVQALGESGSREMLRVLREHACSVVMNPKVVMDAETDSNAVPVTYFSVQQLMAIWNETSVVPRVDADTAAIFRPEGSHDDVAAAPVSEDVQPAPVVMASRPHRPVEIERRLGR